MALLGLWDLMGAGSALLRDRRRADVAWLRAYIHWVAPLQGDRLSIGSELTQFHPPLGYLGFVGTGTAWTMRHPFKASTASPAHRSEPRIFHSVDRREG